MIKDFKPFPKKKYQIIYADPPFSYKDKASSGKRGSSYKYKTQTEDWIERLPVKDIADDNCVLFLWVPFPKIFDCRRIIKKWGFEYKTVGFVWVKMNKIANTIFWGMGNWTRANVEICLIAVKGKPKRIHKGIHQVVFSRIEKHSKKPDKVRKKIVELMGDLPRIELFAREKNKGWDVWGNEV